MSQYYPKYITRPDGASIVVASKKQHEAHVGYPVSDEGNPLWCIVQYPCGCSAGPGPFNLPRYCPEHGSADQPNGVAKGCNPVEDGAESPETPIKYAEPPTLQEILEAGYSQEAAAGIFETEQKCAASGMFPYGPNKDLTEREALLATAVATADAEPVAAVDDEDRIFG